MEPDLFNVLQKSVILEDIGKGRKGAILVNNLYDLIPLVRTTTCYKNPVQKFSSIHHNIMDKIRKKLKQNVLFNNAMIEIYDSNYRDMKFHSDQSLDLDEDSYICLFSSYQKDSNNPNDMRKLYVQNKISKIESEITLDNNSMIVFSVSNNLKYLHKIILEKNMNPKNKWMGITFRLSKTFIKIVNDIPYIQSNNKILSIANKEEQQIFYKHKANENNQIDYVYPEINYTISVSDTLSVYK